MEDFSTKKSFLYLSHERPPRSTRLCSVLRLMRLLPLTAHRTQPLAAPPRPPLPLRRLHWPLPSPRPLRATALTPAAPAALSPAVAVATRPPPRLPLRHDHSHARSKAPPVERITQRARLALVREALEHGCRGPRRLEVFLGTKLPSTGLGASIATSGSSSSRNASWESEAGRLRTDTRTRVGRRTGPFSCCRGALARRARRARRVPALRVTLACLAARVRRVYALLAH